ncbi:MAG TPA: dUTP diphosphatase [Solirubrobacterales bacterium]
MKSPAISSGPIARTGCWCTRKCLRRRCIGLATWQWLSRSGTEREVRRTTAGRVRRTSLSVPYRLRRVQLSVKKLKEDARLPSRAHEGDAGLDLYACEPAHIGPGERWGVGTGVGVQIPEGHAGLVLPRSGLARDHGIALVNAPGLIDSGYRGELRVLLLNTDPAETFRVEPGDRIAQLVLTPIVTPEVIEASALTESARGQGGFGSSGR